MKCKLLLFLILCHFLQGFETAQANNITFTSTGSGGEVNGFSQVTGITQVQVVTDTKTYKRKRGSPLSIIGANCLSTTGTHRGQKGIIPNEQVAWVLISSVLWP